MRNTFCTLFFTCLAVFAHGQNKVAIIGGGMSGVSAAYYAQELNVKAQIKIYEMEAQLGGNAQTIAVQNSGKEVYVDVGPQYFTEGPWDKYIEFLKLNDLYDNNSFYRFIGSICVQQVGVQKPVFITPLNGWRGEKLGRLLQFKKFYNAALDIYREPDGDYEKHIGAWVEQLPNKENFKVEVIYPFLAASLGTSVEEIKKTATLEIVKLFAFRKASSKNTYSVMKKGMGQLIQEVGAQLESSGVDIQVASKVIGVKKWGDQFLIEYDNSGKVKTDTVDFLVLAVHADQARNILDVADFPELKETLGAFEYFEAHIVIHRDSSFVNNEKKAFMNVCVNDNFSLVSHTMNLEMIHSSFKGIYKSWLPPTKLEEIKKNGDFIHEVTFYHPMITPEFKDALERLKKGEERIPNLFFAGGWSQGLETQETAVTSGQKAAAKILRYFN